MSIIRLKLTKWCHGPHRKSRDEAGCGPVGVATRPPRRQEDIMSRASRARQTTWQCQSAVLDHGLQHFPQSADAHHSRRHADGKGEKDHHL